MIFSRRLVQPLILRALREDRAFRDITSKAVVPSQRQIRARIYAKAPGIVAGAQVAAWVFETVDRRIRCTITRSESHPVRRGQVILALHGPARSILAAERTALNLLGPLSGVATLTHQFVQRVRGYPVKIMDTRKTLPGLRVLEKYAVRVGGGYNHRMGLDDAVLIKTNHLKALGQGAGDGGRGKTIQLAIRKAKARNPTKIIEVEVCNMSEFKSALKASPDIILLDNWSVANIRRAVALRKPMPHAPRPTPLLEVSGGLTLDNVRTIAKTGVDRISVGRLTHSAPSLDVSLEVC